MKPTGTYRYLWYKGVRQLGAKKSAREKGFRNYRRDKQHNRIMKRSERHIFREYLKRYVLND